MKNSFLFVAVTLLLLVWVPSSIAEVKRVEVQIGGYLCGN